MVRARRTPAKDAQIGVRKVCVPRWVGLLGY